MTKVLHLFKNYYPPTPGGVEGHINDVVHSLQGFEHIVLTAARAGEREMDDDRGVVVVRAPVKRWLSTMPIVPSWKRWIAELKPDVIHAHMPNPTGETAIMRSGVPYVATYHADIVGRGPVGPAYQVFLSRFLRRAHRVIAGSQRLADSVPALRRVAAKITVVPYGVDAASWATRPAEADDLAARFRSPIVLLLGRLVHYKGAAVAVEAMRDVDAMLLVVGDGPEKLGAETRAKELGLTDKVHFIGEVADDERAAYYHAADLFVLPSVNRGESYGIVQAEAMAAGTPSVSTELGTGTSWVNQHGETGLVVPPRDPSALARAINELLSDRERLARMGAAAKQRVHDHLTRDVMLERLREIYTSVTSSR